MLASSPSQGKFLRSLVCAAMLLGGCTTVHISDRPRTRTYLGLVRVVVPQRSGDLVAYSLRAVGVGWEAGPWLGWRSDSWFAADPAKCQLLVVIRSEAQSRNAVEVIRSLEGRNPCVIDETGSLRR